MTQSTGKTEFKFSTDLPTKEGYYWEACFEASGLNLRVVQVCTFSEKVTINGYVPETYIQSRNGLLAWAFVPIPTGNDLTEAMVDYLSLTPGTIS